MFIKTVATKSGINPIKFDETSGVFYWILNTGSSTIYASTEESFTAGDDGAVSLGPKESRRLETNNDTIYILGEGQVEIHNQRDGICSFKQAPTSSGGGGTVDAYTKTESDARYAMKSDVPDSYTKTESDTKYAQKSEIPTSLPANGGNSDTTDAINGLIILNSENIALRTVEGYKKWVCMANTVPNSAGYITAGIWFKNNLSYSITAQIIVYAAKKAPTIQAGYGTGTMKDMLEKGSGREWFANTTLETTPTPVSMIVPSGKTGYFGFNRTTEGQEAYINDVKAYTTKDIRLM